MKNSILLCDDDEELCELLREFLELEGFAISLCHRGDRLMDTLKRELPAGLVLDIMLPGQPGLEVLRAIRASGNPIPVLMLSARGDDNDRILGLELGADDYLAKPCNPRELAARLRALLRRQDATDISRLHCGTLHLDSGRRLADVAGQPLQLTPTEFACLRHLLSLHPKVCDKASLSEQVLGRPLESYDRSIDMHLSKLRRKLQTAGFSGLETVRGVGWRLNPEDAL